MLDSLLDDLEEVVNGLADKDLSWWPFVWIRPARDARLSKRRGAAIALLYGLPMALLACIALDAMLPAPVAERASVAALLTVPATMLLFLAVLVGPMWNRRAARLARRRDWGR